LRDTEAVTPIRVKAGKFSMNREPSLANENKEDHRIRL